MDEITPEKRDSIALSEYWFYQQSFAGKQQLLHDYASQILPVQAASSSAPVVIIIRAAIYSVTVKISTGGGGDSKEQWCNLVDQWSFSGGW